MLCSNRNPNGWCSGDAMVIFRDSSDQDLLRMLCRLKILKRKRMQKGETASFKPGKQIPKKKGIRKNYKAPMGLSACLHAYWLW